MCHFADLAHCVLTDTTDPQGYATFFPLDTALICPPMGTVFCQGVTLALNIAALCQSLWRSAFLALPWAPEWTWWGGLLHYVEAAGYSGNHHGHLGHSLSPEVSMYMSQDTLCCCVLNDLQPSFYLGFLFFLHPPTCGVWCWGSCGREVRTWSPAPFPILSPPSTIKAFVCQAPPCCFLLLLKWAFAFPFPWGYNDGNIALGMGRSLDTILLTLQENH